MNKKLWGFYYDTSPTPPPVIDPDAQAFMTAIGIANNSTIYYASTPWQITGSQMWLATSALVTSLKSAGIWSTQKAIYIMLGGTAFTHKFNLKDPRDLDAAFRIVFNGTWIHSATGAMPTYGTSAYGDTKFIPNSTLISGSVHVAFYSGSDGQTGTDQIDIGAFTSGNNSAIALCTRYNASGIIDKTTSRNGAGSGSTNVAVANYYARGMYSTNRSSSAVSVYKNGVSIGSNTDSNTTLPTNSILIAAMQNSGGTPALFSDRECRFACIGNALTSTQLAQLNTIVETYQQALNRGINNSIYFYGDSFTGGYYGGIDDTNRFGTLVGQNFNYPPSTYTAVSGQSVTQGCTAAVNFDFTKIARKSIEGGKGLLFCFSMFNELGVTVTTGKPGVPFTNTPTNMAVDATSMFNYANGTCGWSYTTEMCVVTDYLGNNPSTSGPNNPSDADIIPFYTAFINAATALGIPVISQRAYMAAHGGTSLLVSSINAHPNLPGQAPLAQNIINNFPF